MAAFNTFMHHLSMAACEWFLIFLMFVDALLGFILAKFAHHCELQTPCLFCTRLDHVFGNEKYGSFLSLFCNKHRAEVSSLISCDLHDKLADVREMCDDCFMSIMKQNVSKKEGKMGIKKGYPKPYLNKNFVRVPSNSGTCSCCKIQWKPKPKGAVRLGVSKLNMIPPFPRVTGQAGGRFHRRNSSKKTRDKISKNSTPCLFENNIHVDAVSDSGCADLKFNYDTESDDSFYEFDCEDFDKKDMDNVKENSPNQDFDSKSNEINDHDREASTSSDKREGYESPATHSVSEIKGESDVDKLKRQVEYDQGRLRLLYTELEEERNASAIAADEAMAMITRLQEEKAALHMEALQYLRMMDEQAEYDMEALDKANDLVAEKDKEIQDLEAELEYFRSRYDDENDKLKENHTQNGNSKNQSVLVLEDEKNYILQSLSELEKKFHQFSSENDNINVENHKEFSILNGSKKRVGADGGEVDVDTLENEILDLNERLEALESDRDFLEHACNMVQSHGGLEFIQEIAQHLHDLRRVRFDRT